MGADRSWFGAELEGTSSKSSVKAEIEIKVKVEASMSIEEREQVLMGHLRVLPDQQFIQIAPQRQDDSPVDLRRSGSDSTLCTRNNSGLLHLQKDSRTLVGF